MTVQLAVGPTADSSSAADSCELAFKEEVGGQLSAEMKAAVENGVHSSYLQGIFSIKLNCSPS